MNSHSPRASVLALGCKLSQAEGQTIAEELAQSGFIILPFGQAVELVVVHSCTVTDTAAAKTRKYLGRAKHLAKLVIAAGCHAVLDGQALLENHLADMVVDHEHESDIPHLSLDWLRTRLEILDALPVNGLAVEFVEPFATEERTRKFLPIQTGCNRSCSYCRVRLARGPSRSLSIEQVKTAISEAIGTGRKEIVLAGVDLADWHSAGCDLKDLLSDLLSILPKDIRLRLSSLEPDHGLIYSIAKLMLQYPLSLARHLHLPLQSGCDEILSAMGRGYTAGEYLMLLSELKRSVDDICLGADVLVGFPGESDEHYLTTRNFLETAPLSYLHVFPFSPRPGTHAAGMKCRVNNAIVKKRVDECRSISQQKWQDYRKSLIETQAIVLVESKQDKETGAWGGLSSNYIRVWGDKLAGKRNQWVTMTIKSLSGNGMWGEEAESLCYLQRSLD